MSFEFPDLPNQHALFAMLTTVFALFMFTRKQIPLEVSSMVILALMVLAFSLFPFSNGDVHFEAVELFSGFGHEALVTVCALMVIGQGLVKTGALAPLGSVLTKAWMVSPMLSALVTLILGGVLSAFINNTPIVVLLLPILITVSVRTKKSPSKILMPMGFATIVGGMTTTIGTSTNLLVVSVASDMGLEPMQMFDFLVPAAMGSGVAILYLWLIAPLLLPDIKVDTENTSPRLFHARLHLDEDSAVIGKTLAEARKMLEDGLNLLRINRDDHYIVPMPDVMLKEGDRLRVRDTSSRIRAAAKILKATLYSDETQIDDEHPLMAENQTVFEMAVVTGSPLDGQNLRYTNFLQRYDLFVLALHRAGRDIWKPDEEIMDVTLQSGDVLLVQGEKDNLLKLKASHDFLVLDSAEEVPEGNTARITLLILLGVVVTAGVGLVPIAASSMAGAVLMILFKCMTTEVAMRALSSSVIFVVVASLAIGQSLEVTGGSQYMTQVFLYVFQDASPFVMLSALMLMFGILTNIVSNNAAAVIGTPVAIGIAQQLGVDPMPFILAILFGANLSFATPMSYKTNLLVMNAGNYSFNDFVKVGLPLTLILWVAYSFILNYLYL